MNYFRTWGALIILALTTSAWAFNLGFDFKFGGSGSGRGFVDLLPSLSWSPSSKAFGNVSTNVQRSWLFTLTNAGNDIAEQIKVSVTGTGFRNYSGNCPTGFFNLSSGRNCTTKVAFKPTSAASFTGYLNYSAPNIAKVPANLTGTGVAGAGDTTPDQFTFTDKTDVAADGGQDCGTAITVAGIDAASAISASGDTGYGYKVNGGSFTNSSGTVVLNDTVSPCVNRSSSNSTATAATVTIGGVSDTYTVTTVAAPSYILEEYFTAASLPTDWTNGSATFPGGYMQGINGQFADTKTFTATGHVFVAAKVTLVAGGAMPTNFPNLLKLMNGTTSLAFLQVASNGKIYANVTGASGVGSTNTGIVSVGGTVYLQIEYNKATSIATVWSSTNGTTWINQTSTAAGTANQDVTKIRLQSAASDTNSTWQWDDLRVSTTQISY